MKIFYESVEDVQYLKEADKEGKTSLFIKGVFAQADLPNRNKRIYPLNVLEREINRYRKESIDEDKAMGELGHPQGPQLNLDRACILIKELVKDGSNFVGKAKVVSTPMGQVVSGLIGDGVKLGVSTRALGSLKPRHDGINEVLEDLRLVAVDVVADPSGPDCWVGGIMENVEWIYDEKLGWKAQELVEDTKKVLKKMTMDEIERNKFRLFEGFLKTL